MYYDEQVINGVLCHRGLPDGEWIPFTAEQLTQRLVAALQPATPHAEADGDDGDNICYNGNHPSKDGVCLVDGGLKPARR